MRKKATRKSSKKSKRPFGGRNTSGGVGYEVDVAVWMATRMLVGGDAEVVDGVPAQSVASIALQTADVIDDVVLDLRESDAKVFISAKRRIGHVPLGDRSKTFVEVAESMVNQYQALSATARNASTFVWALPTTAGQAATHHLLEALKAFRDESPRLLRDFLARRSARERAVISNLIEIIKRRWKKVNGRVASHNEIKAMVSRIRVEVLYFEFGMRHERIATDVIAANVVTASSDARKVWRSLREMLSDANRRGLKFRSQQFRAALTAAGIRMKGELDYAGDVDALIKMTSRKMLRLREHSYLRFGESSKDEIHLPRSIDAEALFTSVVNGHRLLTGEPGCGKSGLVHKLAEELLQRGCPVVLVLAEEIGDGELMKGSGIPDLTHALDDVLSHWPDGTNGYLITDALDAVRDPDLHAELIRLLESVLLGESNWTVVASVREFDLKHSQHLRALFPGKGTVSHCSADFSEVAHFHLGRLRDQDLDALVDQRPEIKPFIDSARASQQSESLHQSPFFLRLAADLLKSGVPSSRLADWNSPTLLLRKFWESRVGQGTGEGDREAVLQRICRLMMTRRSMSLSIKELGFDSAQRNSVNDLRSLGILQGPSIKHGMRVGDEAIRFSHHLLHDYVMAKVLIPSMAAPFVAFAMAEPLAPVFYRQSFLMALDELWDGAEGVNGFWRACLDLEECPQLHSFTRILAPLLAARRVTGGDDLMPLVECIRKSSASDSPALKAALHLSSGLQDVAPALIGLGASAWCEYAKQLAILLSEQSGLESPLLFLLDRLLEINAVKTELDRKNINEAGGCLLEHHLTKPVNFGWRFVAATGTKAVCRTFDSEPAASERILLRMLSPQRAELFPYEDLFDLAHEIKHLGSDGGEVVRRLFDVAFSTEPKGGEHRTNGSLILRFKTETRQDWELNRYVLSEYYQGMQFLDPALATILACIAWNGDEERQHKRWGTDSKRFQHKFSLRGQECTLSTNGYQGWGREFAHHENTIVDAFVQRLRSWCERGNCEALESMTSAFATVNRSSVMWLTVLEVAGEFPSQLGVLLEEVVHVPLMLTMPDFRYGAVSLFSALHRLGGNERRDRLERTLLSLPSEAPLYDEEPRDPVPDRISDAQSVLLGELDEANLFLDETKALWLKNKNEGKLERNHRPQTLTPFVPSLHGSSICEKEPKVDPLADAISAMRDSLDKIRNRDGDAKVTGKIVSADLDMLWRVGKIIRRTKATHSSQAANLWGRLVETCSRIAGRASPHRAPRLFSFVRGVLLRAASDPIPAITEEDHDPNVDLGSWGWPSPRSDAAEGLPFLVCRLRRIDHRIVEALRQLVKDGSRVVRLELAKSVWALCHIAPALMWELIDDLIASESKFGVLVYLLDSLRQILSRDADGALARMKSIAARAKASAPVGHDVHKRLTGCFLFRFLRSGDQSCWDHVASKMEICEDESVAESLVAQLHSCRAGKWLTAGDAIVSDNETDERRARAWRFFRELLFTAQRKLAKKTEEWQLLRATEPTNETRKEQLEAHIRPLTDIVDGIAAQLHFGSGAFAERHKRGEEDRLSLPQVHRFWEESGDLFEAVANEPHPQTAKHVVESMYHLMPADPKRTFVCAAKSIQASNAWGFLRESLVVDDIVRLIQRLLADHRDVLRTLPSGNSECLEALLRVLDLFVDAGWSKARQLTHRLEDIYR